MTKDLEIMVSEAPLGICDVCGKETTGGGVYASIFSPTSFLYCPECAKSGKEPYSSMVHYIAIAGHFPDDINENYRAVVRHQLKLHNISEERFIKDVDKVIKMYNDIY